MRAPQIDPRLISDWPEGIRHWLLQEPAPDQQDPEYKLATALRRARNSRAAWRAAKRIVNGQEGLR